jgi:hypothetical protein
MGDGFFSELFTHVGQWGTHVDPSAHFHKGLRNGRSNRAQGNRSCRLCVSTFGRDGNTFARSEGASTHSGPPSPKRRQMYDVKPGRATICLPLLLEDQNVLNAMLAKTVGVWMRPSAVVENMLGQLTESRGRNEDRL